MVSCLCNIPFSFGKFDLFVLPLFPIVLLVLSIKALPILKSKHADHEPSWLCHTEPRDPWELKDSLFPGFNFGESEFN